MVVVENTEMLYEWIEAHLGKKYFGTILIKVVDGAIVHVEETTSINLLKFNEEKGN